ncbi:hypothetical protein IVG45_11305 [Methylomonas sp. LL1]|uniref:hypothetical protein n=1 Tax=Methylomonas sp. LL1 TaxID=2785785 RepID=UPI0018C42DF0|nr:hypothetical protein [Methylomonas sp. LL1]QPK61492.1 hypothetical protein IVG45_11305 [Methylomonas sp. LL1]
MKDLIEVDSPMGKRAAPKWQATGLLLALLAAAAPCAGQQPSANVGLGIPQTPMLTADNINLQTEILPDPAIAADNARQVLSRPDASVQSVNPIPLAAGGVRISDPTQMTGSFSQALNRISGKPGQGGPIQALPDIQLAAKSIRHQGSKTAMITVAGKTHMVKPGGKFTVMANNTIYEIQVNKIEKDHVAVTVMPMGRQMILE